MHVIPLLWFVVDHQGSLRFMSISEGLWVGGETNRTYPSWPDTLSKFTYPHIEFATAELDSNHDDRLGKNAAQTLQVDAQR